MNEMRKLMEAIEKIDEATDQEWLNMVDNLIQVLKTIRVGNG